MRRDRSGAGSTSTLIFAEAKGLRDGEHPLNWIAATVTSPKNRLCHVELSIGSTPGSNGTIGNVLRVFSGEEVELCSRTGLNPSLKYIEISHNTGEERDMLNFAREQCGKPFSMSAMVRAPCLPRTTNYNSWFCAELTAAALQKGGLLPIEMNPGSASPDSLYRHFSRVGAATANPYALRNFALKKQGFSRVGPVPVDAPFKLLECHTEKGKTAPFPIARIHTPRPEIVNRDADDFLRLAVKRSGVLDNVQERNIVGLFQNF